MSDPSLEILPG
jgi:hypothetical protein